MRLTASSGSLRLRTIALRRSNRPEWPVAGRARRSKQQSWLTNSGCRCEDWGELECIQLHLRGTHWRLGPEPVLRSELHRCRHGAIEECPLSERFRMQIRSEFFNLFNHPQFRQPGNVIENPGTFGLSAQTLTRPDGTTSTRQIQLALKLNF